LLVCLAVSASLHAAIVVLLPGRVPENVSHAVHSLEVVIMQPTLLSPVAPAVALVRHRMERAAPHTPRVPVAAQRRTERATAEPLLPPPVEPWQSSSTVDYRELEPAAPERRSPATSAAISHPAYHAAYLSTPAPRYPEAARRSGEQGTVTLRVRVARDGAASQVTVEKSSGSPHLDAAALEAVKAWRFTPARRGADAVDSWMLVPIVFRLDGVS